MNWGLHLYRLIGLCTHILFRPSQILHNVIWIDFNMVTVEFRIPFSSSCGAEKISVTHPLPPFSFAILFIESFLPLRGGLGAPAVPWFVPTGFLHPLLWQCNSTYILDFYVQTCVALIHQRGKKNCYLVRVIALVSVGRSVFRFDFSFYFYFGVCFVWVLQLVLAMFRQGLVRRAMTER